MSLTSLIEIHEFILASSSRHFRFDPAEVESVDQMLLGARIVQGSLSPVVEESVDGVDQRSENANKTLERYSHILLYPFLLSPLLSISSHPFSFSPSFSYLLSLLPPLHLPPSPLTPISLSSFLSFSPLPSSLPFFSPFLFLPLCFSFSLLSISPFHSLFPSHSRLPLLFPFSPLSFSLLFFLPLFFFSLSSSPSLLLPSSSSSSLNNIFCLNESR